MKKKLLTIFAVLVLIVAMVATVVACGEKTPTKKPDDKDKDKDEVIDLSDLAAESATAMQTGISGLMKAALDESKEKSYDATIFAKVKVGDDVDVDVKLHVAATFGKTNSGLVDVIVGGQSYVTLYTEDNIVYVGEALTQEAMNWFKINAAEADGLVDKFFPKFLDMLAEKDAANTTLYQRINKTVGSILGFVPVVGPMLFVKNQADGIVKEELGGGAVKYTNNVTFAEIQTLLPILAGPPINLDIDGLLAGLGDGIRGLVDTVCTIIFGGNLDALMGKNGASIPADAAPAIQLNFTSKDGQLTGLELKYANDIAFDSEKPNDKTDISVEFGLEDVNVTTDSKTAIVTNEISKGIKNAVEPAIKLTIAAEVPGKDVGATVNAYVVPEIGVSAHEHYSVPTQEYYTKAFYWVDGKRAEMEKDHKCAEDKTCIHVDGWRRPVEEGHDCGKDKVCNHDYDYETGKVTDKHECLNKNCKHYDEIDTTDFTKAKAYAVAVKANGDEMQLACDVDVTKLGSNGIVVLRIDLTDMWELLGVPAEDRANLPTTYQKTINFWQKDAVAAPTEEIDPDEYENTPPAIPTEDANKKDEEVKLPDNLIDKVFAIVRNGFEFGKVIGLLNPALDFVKEIYNDAVKDAITSDKDNKTATIDAAAILEALVGNKTISGSKELDINKEGNVTKYLTSLKGVAGLVDNIMRYTDPNKKGLKEGEAYTEAELKALVKKYAGIDITDKAFDNTSLVLTGIRGDAKADDGLGFTAELKSEGKTVIKLTMKVDIIDAKDVPALKAIGSDFVGAELEKLKVQATDEEGQPKVDENGDPVWEFEVDEDGELIVKDGYLVYKKVDGEALNNINALMKAILKAYEAKEKAAA